VLQAHQLGGIGERQRFDEYAAHDTEYRRRGADSEREGEDGHDGERRRAPQRSHAVCEVP
jgi:hypothetical protein